MIKKLKIDLIDTAKKILELQKASYLIEAEIINFYEIPPLKDTIETIMKCDEEFWGYFIETELAGIISFKIENRILDIHRVAVHPQYFKQGIASKLIHFVESFKGFDTIVVSTGKANKPAVNLYLSNNFKIIEDIKINNEIILTKFEKSQL